MSNEKDCTEISMGDNHNQLHCSEYFLPFYQLKTSFQIELNNEISVYQIYSQSRQSLLFDETVSLVPLVSSQTFIEEILVSTVQLQITCTVMLSHVHDYVSVFVLLYYSPLISKADWCCGGIGGQKSDTKYCVQIPASLGIFIVTRYIFGKCILQL